GGTVPKAERQRTRQATTMRRLVLQDLCEAARKAARVGKHAEAEDYVLQALALDGSSPHLWALLSEVAREPEVARIAVRQVEMLERAGSSSFPHSLGSAAQCLRRTAGAASSLWRIRAVAAFLLVLVVLALWGMGRAYARRYEGRFYPGVSIAGLDVGGLSEVEAAFLLQAQAQRIGETPIDLVWGGGSVRVTAWEAGLDLDLPGTLDAAIQIGRGSGIWQGWAGPVQLGLWGKEVPLSGGVDPERLRRTLDKVSRAVERPALPPAFAWDGRDWNVFPGQDGRRLERGETERALRETLLSLVTSHRSGVVAVRTAVVTDAVALAPGEIASLMDQLRGASEPLLLRCGEFTRTVGPAEFAGWFSLSRGPQGVRLQLDAAAVREFVECLAQEVDRAPQDGRLVIEGNRAVEFRLAEHGRALDVPAAEALLRETWDRRLGGEAVDTVELPVRVIPGRPDALQLQLGILEAIGQGSSSFVGSSPERANNIWVGGRELNGRLIAPGELFSLNDALAPISWEKGYQVAPIISEGVLVLGLGGGLCQVSTTVYRAALFTGLEIVERHPHQWRIPYYEQDAPPGFDATIIQGGPDLKFRNNTGHYLLLEVVTDLEQARQTVRFYGTSPGWRVTVEQPEILTDGLVVSYRRRVERAGELLSDETFYSFYTYHEW
ncbi:MAG: VanW family protein, partial [Chloroflexia bacterium]